MNVLSFVLFGVDKRRAVEGAWRISEKALMTACALFGSAGGLLGMKVFHHKTRHALFVVGVPALFVAQVALLLYLLYRVYWHR